MSNVFVYDGAAKTVTIGTTGEITIDSFTDNLPAGVKVIIANVHFHRPAVDSATLMYLKLYRGTTVLDNEEARTHRFAAGRLSTSGSVWQILAVDGNAPANATYRIVVNVTSVDTGASTSWTVEVKAMVLLANFADYVAGGVTNVANGSTATVVSKTITLNPGKYVIVMRVHPERASAAGDVFVGAGNLRLRIGSTVVASNEFRTGAYSTTEFVKAVVGYLHSQTASGSVTIAIEAHNNSGVVANFYGRFIIFNVSEGYFLDTTSVAIGTTQTTIGNLSTGFLANTEIGVISIVSLSNTTTSERSFTAGNVVLQQNNSTTDQVANELSIHLTGAGTYGECKPYIFLGRYVPPANNPSYQAKATAPVTGLNGEAKILAFSLFAPVLVEVTDSGTAVEAVSVSANVFAADSATGAEVVGLTGSVAVADSGSGVEVANLRATVFASDAGTGVDFSTAGIYQPVDDAGSGADDVTTLLKEVSDYGTTIEMVSMSKEAFDAGAGFETIDSPVFLQLSDSGAGVDLPAIAVPQSDVGSGVDVVDLVKEVLDTGAGFDAVLFVSREVLDIGTAVELPTAITTIPVLDSGTGLDVVGIIAEIAVIDTGTGVEKATRTLSMFGNVVIDEMEIIGFHSIPYDDLVRDGLPIQVQKNATTDSVFIDNVQVGDILVEWEDRVADVYRGRRTLTIMGLVRIVD